MDIEEIEKSSNDSKLYKVIKLQNGLTATLISDVDSETAAAGLCLSIGSFLDPENIPGLAHLLEHMIFKGSEKFQANDKYDQFLRDHGGSNNAETELERTCFHFTVNSTHFREALDIFSQSLKKPLLNKESMEKEINIVHSEWANTLHNETDRFSQLLGSLAKPRHPISKFYWGNAESLKPDAHRDVHAALQEFHQKYYRAPFMYLAVLGPETIETLERWVQEYFKHLPSSEDTKPSFDHLGLPYDTPEFRKVLTIVPVTRVQQVQLTWSLESLLPYYREKPLNYLSFLIGHEGEGSLFHSLLRRNWARSIYCGKSMRNEDDNATCSLFKIIISLTDLGLGNVNNVITVVFQYMVMLRYEGPHESIWKELHQIDENDFDWVENEEPEDFVKHLAIDMTKYRARDYVTGRRIVKTYNKQLINSCLDKLKPNVVNIAIWDKSIESETDAVIEKEQWYKTSYVVRDIQPEWLHTWSNCEKLDEHSLPRPNLFVAQNFSLLQQEHQAEKFKEPLSVTDKSRVWFKPDQDFHVPKASINLYMRSTEVNQSSLKSCINDLYVMGLNDVVDRAVFGAHVAHLSYIIKECDSGLTVCLHGFSDKLPLLMESIIDCMADFKITPHHFNNICTQMKEDYQNLCLDPNTLNKTLRKSLLHTKTYSSLEKLERLKEVSMNSFTEFVQQYTTGVFTEWLVQGNVTCNDALILSESFNNKLKVTPAENAETLSQTQVTILPLGVCTYTMKNSNHEDENSTITNYFQNGRTNLHDLLINELIVLKMQQPFSKIREDLMIYDSELETSDTFGIMGFKISACFQASKFTLEELNDHIEAFLEKSNDDIQTMTKRSFDNFVTSVIKQKDSSYANLQDEVNAHWQEIIRQTYMFDRPLLEAKELRTVKLAEFKLWAVNFVVPSPIRRSISVQISGHSPAALTESESKKPSKRRKKNSDDLPHKEITDVNQFKDECEKYTFIRKD